MRYLVQLGYYTPATDSFATAVDLNDGLAIEIVDPDGLDIAPPPIDVFAASNPHANGDAIVALRTASRTIMVHAAIGPQAAYAAIQAIIQSLIAVQAQVNGARAISARTQTRPHVALLLQPPGSTTPVYADLQAMAIDLPEAGQARAWIQLKQDGLMIEMLCRPFFRGKRQTLVNMVANPGFEATGNNAITVFSENYANADAYTTIAGTAPTITGTNQMTVYPNSFVTFGSPAWGPFSAGQFRFQYTTGLNVSAFYHWNSPGNYLMATINSTALSIASVSNNIPTTLATAGGSWLVSGTWYYIVLRHMPNSQQLPQNLRCELYADNIGTIGTLIAQITSATGVNAPWLTGQMGFNPAGANLVLGGVASKDSFVQLFGPAPWLAASVAAGNTSAAWDRGYSNNYQGGPVASMGAARIDFPPAGVVEGYWQSFNNTSGALVTQTASPVLPNTSYMMSVQTRSAGLSAGAKTYLILYWFDASGNTLGGSYQVTLTGNTTYWTPMTAAITTAANAAYIGMVLMAYDGTAGASANATIWFDNAQIWPSSLGAAMPYCETRFATAPATIVLSGLVGDVPAPTLLSIGTLPSGGYVAPNSSISASIGRRSSITNLAHLTGAAQGGTINGGTVAQVLDGASSSNVTLQYRASAAAPMVQQGTAADLAGTYHLYGRMRMYDNTFATQTAQITIYETPAPWSGDMTQVRGYAQSPAITPWTGQNWQVIDGGIITLPPFAKSTEATIASIYETVFVAIPNTTNGVDVDWLALVPIDTEIAIAQFSTPGMTVNLTGWIWLYLDGTWQAQGQGSSVSWSLETTATPDVALAGGGPGAATGSIVIPNGDGSVNVDPTIGGGVNQFVVVLTDNAAEVLPVATQVEYAPLYVFPR